MTSPNLKDSDWDGVVDSAEDNDNDRLGNLGEQRFGTDPGERDTDGDGVPDGAEDHDRDGRLNAAEQDQRPVPGGLVPSLSRARFDDHKRVKACNTYLGKSALKRCTFGPTGTGRRVVIMGDSHAMMIAGAFAKVAETDRFRLVTMFKGSCIPALGARNKRQWELDKGASCAKWRLNALKSLNSFPPDLLILTASESYGLIDTKGRTIPKSRRPAVWREGVARLLERLPAKTQVLLLGDVPNNRHHPVHCLQRNPRDMSRCTTRRQPLSARGVEQALRAQAAKPGVHFATLYGSICSYDPCPLVQGKTLMWRDREHLTNTFANKLTPSVRKIMRPLLPTARLMRNHVATHELRRALIVTILAAMAATAVAMPVAAADRDHDGLRDAWEAKYGVTSPSNNDSDWDGVVDGAEDSDGDRLSNRAEQKFGTNPGVRDTDGDGRKDGAEDHDRDGRTNVREQEQRPLPARVKPSLRWAKWDRPQIAKRCVLGYLSTQLLRCRDGDLDGTKSIVLMGDSHATAMLDPIRRAARTEGWRVTSMLKGACAVMPGTMTRLHWSLDRGHACRTWRRKALQAIKADPPDLLVVTNSDNLAFVDRQGKSVPKWQRPALWREGIIRLAAELPAGTELLFFGDVPDNRVKPITCLKRHPGDMSRCVTVRVPPNKRKVEVAQRAAIKATGQHFATLHNKICPSDPCPLVQGQTMIWRSEGHLSGTFARKLTPSLRKILRDVLE